MKGLNKYVLLAAVPGLGVVAGCARFQSRPLSPVGSATSFESRSLTNEPLHAFLQANRLGGEWPRRGWDLSALTFVAFYYQPDLALARAQWASAQAAKVTAGERPNPSVTVTPAYNPDVPGAPTPWIATVALDVPIETAGKRGYRMAQAQHLAEATQWKLAGTIWQVRSRVRDTLLSLYSATQMRSLLEQQETAQSNVVHLLEGQLALGSVSGFELTQARVALDTTRLSREDAERQYVQARGQLGAALGLPLRALADIQFSFGDFALFPETLTSPEVRRQALFNRTDVRSALAEYAASQSALQWAIAGQYPDVHLSPGYAYNSGSAGDNQWELGLTVSLPVLNRNRGAIAEATAKRQEIAAQFLATQAKVIGEIDSSLASYRVSIHQADTAAALLTNLTQRLDSVRGMQQLGDADPLTVANAQAEFITGELARLDALVKAQQTLGQLEDAVQSPLTLSEHALHNAQNLSNQFPRGSHHDP